MRQVQFHSIPSGHLIPDAKLFSIKEVRLLQLYQQIVACAKTSNNRQQACIKNEQIKKGKELEIVRKGKNPANRVSFY